MSDQNTWTPEFNKITEEQYKQIHPFEYGSTFILKQLIKTSIPTDIKHMENELIKHIMMTYKKCFHKHNKISYN